MAPISNIFQNSSTRNKVKNLQPTVSNFEMIIGCNAMHHLPACPCVLVPPFNDDVITE